MPKKSYLIAYVPVLHKGYIKFFKENYNADGLFILGKGLLSSPDYLRKDLRMMDPETQVKLIDALKTFPSVKLLDKKALSIIDSKDNLLIFPDEDVSRKVAKTVKKASVEFRPVFLRWDRRNLESSAVQDPDEKISARKIDKKHMADAYLESVKSSDIWRRVGAVLLDRKGTEIARAANRAQPSDHSPWMEGDPRSIYNQGTNTELAVFMHAEAALIAESAKKGVKLDGASMYTTTFPCPWCAKLISYAGIAKIFYAEGYGSLDANRLFKDFKVKTYRVPYEPPADLEHPAVWEPYK